MPWHPHFCWVFLKLAKKYLEFLTGRKNNKTHPKHTNIQDKYAKETEEIDIERWGYFCWAKGGIWLSQNARVSPGSLFLKMGKTGTPFMEVDISIVPLSLRFIAGYVDWNDLHIDIYIYTPESSKGVKFEPLGGSRSRYIYIIYIYSCHTY